MITMHMSPMGRAKLRQREGDKLTAYRDSEGYWTIGTGHAETSGIKPIPHEGMTITQAQSDDILATDLSNHYEPLLNGVLRVQLADHEFDALLSIVFNVEAFIHSTAIRLLNHGDKLGCAHHIMDWRIPASIIGRRRTEQVQFLTPYPKE